jgi:uncharacterized protein (TIGR00255 family)
MIRSMTGYGRAEESGADARISCEVRSLNNRYLDVQIKAPRSLLSLESRIKKAVQERFSRGRFDISISRSSEQDAAEQIVINEALAMQYIRALRSLKEQQGLAGDVDVSTVAGFPDIVTRVEKQESLDELWTVVSRCLGRSLDELDRMRGEEGGALAQDMLSRIKAIEQMADVVRTAAPDAVESARKRMTESLARLLAEPPEPARLAQEIALLAERTDITEELTRLGIHLRRFREMLAVAPQDGVGRKLDFLIQELGREANTIASKSLNADISHTVVNIKAELEKIREQAQNIE